MRENYYKLKIINQLKKINKSIRYYPVDIGASLYGKKEFDGILIRDCICFAIEFKKDYYKVENHQLLSMNDFPGMAFINRVNTKKKTISCNTPDEKKTHFFTKIKYNDFAKRFDGLLNIYHTHSKGW